MINEPVVAARVPIPSRYTRAGTVRIDPPPPSAPRLSPISRPTGIATINTTRTASNVGPNNTQGRQRRWCSSGDRPGPSALGNDREAGGRPGPHPTGQVAHGVPVSSENPCGPGGPVPGPAHRDDLPAGREFLAAPIEVVQRDVPGLGGMPGPPLGRLPHIQQHRAPVDSAAGLGGAGRGVLAGEQTGQETHRPLPSGSAADVTGRPAAAALL